MESLPDLVLLKIAEYLLPEDCVNLSLTCKRFHGILPKFVHFEGKDFKIKGPSAGHWAPSTYFDGPKLTGKVKSFRGNVSWKDQGWGNRKGRLMVKLMRPVAGQETPKVIAENNNLFGIAEHNWADAECKLVNDPIVQLSEPNDFYSFERNAGGGGGHSLHVKNFAVILELSR